MIRVVQSVILRDSTGEEYRLVAGDEAPALPEHLAQAAEESGYVEKVEKGKGGPADERPASPNNHNVRKGAK